MADNIRPYVTGKGKKRFQARARVNGVNVSQSFDREGDAKTWLHNQKSAESLGTWIDPRAAKRPFHELVEEYRARWANLSPNTIATYESELVAVLDEFGDKPVGSITTTMIFRWISKMRKKGYADASVKNRFVKLSAALEVAVDLEVIRKNPARAKGVCPEVLELKGGERSVLTPAQVDALATETGKHYAPMVTFLAYTGLRPGEFCALRHRDVNPLNGVIHVRQNQTEPNGKLHVGPTKGKRHRDIHLPRWLSELLTDYLHEHPGLPDARVFHTKRGEVIRTSNFTDDIIKPAIRRLVYRKVFTRDLERFTTYDLRHTFTSLLEDAGVHEWEIARQLGHQRLSTSLGYAHRQPREETLVGAALEQFRPTA